ncbi:hypothetical protein [Streptomyces violascens]|uniref:hypothetical protein n=1 Tax=Streptomyces violascens TaxID=67381 RepID=UPI001676A38D|nr:hypothetical protein [Streptomyces violascens]GGU50937.1 hypothetical protein GCM10010289_84220 [Streptomyces violascens]
MSTNQTPGKADTGHLTADGEGLQREGLTPAEILDRLARAGRVHADTEQKPAPPVRILTEAEYDAASQPLTAAMTGHGNRLGSLVAQEILTETLAAMGVFTHTPTLGTCTALYLPTNPDLFDATTIGQWQHCGDDPDSGDVAWSDGALPATGPGA